MDLLQTVRKEGSRGGRDTNFSWDDVKSDAQRENYLGHSLMAPVGRWQKGKDLNWYAKRESGEDGEAGQSEADRRKEEMRKIKEAEEDAMARALGLPPPDRSANTVPLGMGKEAQSKMNQALKDTLRDDGEDNWAKGRERSDRGKDRSRSPEGRHRKHDREQGNRAVSQSKDGSRRHRYRSRSRSRERRRDRSRNRDRRRRRDGNEGSSQFSERKRESRHYHNRTRSRSPYRDEQRRRRRDER